MEDNAAEQWVQDQPEPEAAKKLVNAAGAAIAAAKAHPCAHCGGLYAEKWPGKPCWHCFDCKDPDNKPLHPDRSVHEEAGMAATVALDARWVKGTNRFGMPALTDEGKRRHAARGISVGYLKDLVKTLPPGTKTADIVKLVVKPETESLRCRYVELPKVRKHVGPPDAFCSHTWAALFADLVAALAHVLRDDQYVWLDVLSVRQWPGNGGAGTTTFTHLGLAFTLLPSLRLRLCH